MSAASHTPVMFQEVLDLLSPKPGGTYLDGTLGSGGHAEGILEKAGPDGRLIGLDKDPEALGRAARTLAAYRSRCVLEHGDFADMSAIAERHGIREVDGVVLDLGVSSPQLDTPQRGFSFQNDGPLDMRMDPSSPVTAASLVASLPEADLADLIYKYGEEPASRRVARAIVDERALRPIETTLQLASVVERAKGGRRGRTHPATQTFQALRITVNRELESLARGIEAGISLLKPGGRMAVITFHSLEDRLVKQAFAAHAGRWESLQAGGRRWVGRAPAVRRVTKKPVVAGEEETRVNPRARSAKLRVIERLNEES